MRQGEEELISAGVGSSRMERRVRLERMLESEVAFASQKDQAVFMKNDDTASSLNFVWREKVVQWCYDVADHLNESRSVVYVAMNILDRYCSIVSHGQPVDEQTYELASMTAIFLAVRISGTGNLRLHELTSMSRGGITIQDVISMGTAMIKELTWDYRILTPLDFIKSLLDCLPSKIGAPRRQLLLEFASYLVEIAVCDVHLSQSKASELALAALLNSLQAQKADDVLSFTRSLEQVDSMKPYSEDMSSLRMRLHCIYTQSADSHRRSSPHLVTEEGDGIQVHLLCNPSTVIRNVSRGSLVDVEIEGSSKRKGEAEPQVTRSKRVRCDLTALA